MCKVINSEDKNNSLFSSEIVIQSTRSKTDTFGTGTKCPSYRGVRLIESQIKGVKKGRDQL